MTTMKRREYMTCTNLNSSTSNVRRIMNIIVIVIGLHDMKGYLSNFWIDIIVIILYDKYNRIGIFGRYRCNRWW